MTTTKKRILLVFGGICLFIAGAVAVMMAKATNNITFVDLDTGLVTNRVSIEGDRFGCSIFSLNEKLPDRIALEYRDKSRKVLDSDVVYLQRVPEDVIFVEATIKHFDTPVSVHIKRP